MRFYFFTFISFLLISISLQGQHDSSKIKKIGFELNTSIYRYNAYVIPSVFIRNENNMFGIGPLILKDLNNFYVTNGLSGVKILYKNYPNRIHNKSNLFYFSDIDINRHIFDYHVAGSSDEGNIYSLSEEYTSLDVKLMLGFGFRKRIYKGIYIGSQIGIGYRKRTIISGSDPQEISGAHLQLGFNLGWD